MKAIANRTIGSLFACAILWALPAQLPAWEPNAKDLDAAISAADFTGYFTNVSTWLNQKLPADPAKRL